MTENKIKQYYARIIKEALKEVENRQNNKEEMFCIKYKKLVKNKANAVKKS